MQTEKDKSALSHCGRNGIGISQNKDQARNVPVNETVTIVQTLSCDAPQDLSDGPGLHPERHAKIGNVSMRILSVTLNKYSAGRALLNLIECA